MIPHCESQLCKETRVTSATICWCKCEACRNLREISALAAQMPHCGQALCIQRLQPGRAIFPSCTCGCPTCTKITETLCLDGPTRPLPGPHPTEEDIDALLAAGPILNVEPVLSEELDALVLPSEAADVGRNRLLLLTEEQFPRAPIVTGSKCSLLRECLYWTRDDVVRAKDEASDVALAGTAGHAIAEEYAKGELTDEREAAILDAVPKARLSRLLECLPHVRRWLDDHRGGTIAVQAEVPVAWDPDAGGSWGQGRGLTPALEVLGLSKHRPYSDAVAWTKIRHRLELGPRTIPATIDLLRFVDGKVYVYDWCFGKTDKRRQIALGALACASIFNVPEVHGVGLYVTPEGVQEVPYELDELELMAQAEEFRQLLNAAPTSEPTPGLHCTHDYCPARASCPVTQETVEALTLADGAPMTALTVLHKAELGQVPPFRIGKPTSREHAEWLLPRYYLLRDAMEKLKEDLEVWAAKEPIATKEGKVWREVESKGRQWLDQRSTLALLRKKGATDEEIGALYVQGKTVRSFRETNK